MQIEIVEIITPKNYSLQGLWVGPQNPKKTIIAIHGLTSNLFSDKKYLPLVNSDTAVILFNNRGHGIVSKTRHLNPQNPKGYDSELGGCAHEVFEDCVDDIEGVVSLVQSRGAEKVYLAGHSTGCQKAVFYASKAKNKQNISGIILLCPVSDYGHISTRADKNQYDKALEFASNSIKNNKPHTFMPEDLWPDELLDAQRFLSLYTPDSSEEIFSYVQPEKDPTTLKSVSVPILVILAGSDEYADRSPDKLLEWFNNNNNSISYKGVIIKDALHNLKGVENEICKEIKDWISV